MSMRLYAENLVYDAVLTPSSVNNNFPVDNIKDPRRTKIFKGTSGSVNIVFDLGSAKQIDSIALVDSLTEDFGFNSLTVEMNSTDSWASPPYQQSVTIDSTNGWANHNTPTVQTYRYVRLVFGNSIGNVSVSKVFIGKSFYNEQICFTYPIDFRRKNNARTTLNRYNQKFVDKTNSVREIKANIPALDKTEVESIFDVIDEVSTIKPIWLNFNGVNVMNDANRFNGYYFLKQDPTASLAAGNYWDIDFNFEEGT